MEIQYILGDNVETKECNKKLCSGTNRVGGGGGEQKLHQRKGFHAAESSIYSSSVVDAQRVKV